MALQKPTHLLGKHGSRLVIPALEGGDRGSPELAGSYLQLITTVMKTGFPPKESHRGTNYSSVQAAHPAVEAQTESELSGMFGGSLSQNVMSELFPFSPSLL